MKRQTESPLGDSSSSRASKALLRRLRYLGKGTPSEDGRVVVRDSSSRSEEFYRDRWRHDKEVRSTHGVNCTGSCSWMVYVRDGIISWETQATDYPETTPDMPDQEPRGCPRGATFSWYSYQPARVRYPYVRGLLLDLWREARRAHDDPVDAWESIVADPAKAQLYKNARGHGGFVRASWDEALELCAAAHVYTIKAWGPDRVGAVSPIPAMSPVSHASGSRYVALTGGAQLSFYDWYADLPPASPQVFGDQTDVPESADWWHAGYLIVWGSNIPVTRTPDAHFMVEARYRGQKVVVVSPDYAEHVKFADDWLAVPPGMDSALAMALGQVVFKEFYVDRQVPFFTHYAKTYTDMPFLVALREHEQGGYVADRFLTAADLGSDDEAAAWKTVLIDAEAAARRCPTAHSAFAGATPVWGAGTSTWRASDPALTLLEQEHEKVEVLLPRFDTTPAGVLRRGVPAMRVGGRLVTTVFDLLLAQYGVARAGLAGRLADRLRRRLAALHAGVAGEADHDPGGRRGPGGARVRPHRRGHRGALDDRHGLGHQPLVQLRHHLPLDHDPAACLRLRGAQRRRLGPLRRPGEDQAPDRLVDAGRRSRLEPAPRARTAAPSGTTWPATSGATRSSAPTPSPRRWRKDCWPARRRSTPWCRPSASAGS